MTKHKTPTYNWSNIKQSINDNILWCIYDLTFTTKPLPIRMLHFHFCYSLLFFIFESHISIMRAKLRPSVQSTPIDNTYVQVKNVLFTWLMIFKKLSNMAPLRPQWYPATMPIFSFPNLSRNTAILHEKILKASRVVCNSFISYLNS